MSIKILDCTLRDGGYVNNWEFNNDQIINIIDSLTESGVEKIECGFISHTKGKLLDSSLYKNIDVINNLLKSTKNSLNTPSYVCLINYGECDINDFPVCSKSSKVVTDIRLAFHKEDINGAFKDCQLLINKGYNVYAQPMVSLRYSDKELINLIEKFNAIEIYAIYIVDSFGSMNNLDFQRLYHLFYNNVAENIKIGYHAHNNLQLAFSNAILFTEISRNKDIIIDSSVYGMGRGAGNLNTELLGSFLNDSFSRKYNIIPLLDIIERYLSAIHRKSFWGFSPAHYLSAVNYCHPNYSSFLINKKQLTIIQISEILEGIDTDRKSNFDKNYIEELYIKYNFDKSQIKKFSFPDFKSEKILVVASGNSVIIEEEKLLDFIKLNKPVIISMNHLTKSINSDYIFFSNQRRFNQYASSADKSKIIISSNINEGLDNKIEYIVDYKDAIEINSRVSDNVTMLFISKLIMDGHKEVFIAGLDGYSLNHQNYSYNENYKNDENEAFELQNKSISESLSILNKKINIKLLTTSIFK